MRFMKKLILGLLLIFTALAAQAQGDAVITPDTKLKIEVKNDKLASEFVHFTQVIEVRDAVFNLFSPVQIKSDYPEVRTCGEPNYQTGCRKCTACEPFANGWCVTYWDCSGSSCPYCP